MADKKGKINCKTCGKASNYCPNCGTACALATSYLEEFSIDDEPLCGDGDCKQNTFKNKEITTTGVSVYIEWCPKCSEVVRSWTD